MLKRALFLLSFTLAMTAGASAASDPLSRLDSLVGKWTCTYHVGSQASSFAASFAFTQNKNWLRETDTWPGGGDEGLLTYVPATRTWTTLVADSGRGTTVFEAKDSGTSTLVYHSVYPNSASMTVTYHFVNAKRYDVHAVIGGAHPSTSSDVCTKT